MREVVTFEFAGQQLVGTFHRPAAWPAVSDLAGVGSGRVVFLWLNSGYLPRSPVGDVIAHLADRFAMEGLASLRIDLPGLGDSQGTLADDTQTYFSKVARGLNVDAANAVSREVCRRFGFSGVIMGGICGASITSIYAAASSESSGIVGLVLLDPSFKLVQPFVAPSVGVDASVSSPGKPAASLRQRLKDLRIRVLETRSGQALRKTWRRCKPVLSPFRRVARSLHAAKLPQDANRSLFDSFCRLAARRLPVLALLAGAEQDYQERFDYVGLAMQTGGHSITRRFLAGTNHSFVEGNGEGEIHRFVTAWVTPVANGLVQRVR